MLTNNYPEYQKFYLDANNRHTLNIQEFHQLELEKSLSNELTRSFDKTFQLLTIFLNYITKYHHYYNILYDTKTTENKKGDIESTIKEYDHKLKKLQIKINGKLTEDKNQLKIAEKNYQEEIEKKQEEIERKKADNGLNNFIQDNLTFIQLKSSKLNKFESQLSNLQKKVEYFKKLTLLPEEKESITNLVDLYDAEKSKNSFSGFISNFNKKLSKIYNLSPNINNFKQINKAKKKLENIKTLMQNQEKELTLKLENTQKKISNIIILYSKKSITHLIKVIKKQKKQIKEKQETIKSINQQLSNFTVNINDRDAFSEKKHQSQKSLEVFSTNLDILVESLSAADTNNEIINTLKRYIDKAKQTISKEIKTTEEIFLLSNKSIIKNSTTFVEEWEAYGATILSKIDSLISMQRTFVEEIKDIQTSQNKLHKQNRPKPQPEPLIVPDTILSVTLLKDIQPAQNPDQGGIEKFSHLDILCSEVQSVLNKSLEQKEKNNGFAFRFFSFINMPYSSNALNVIHNTIKKNPESSLNFQKLYNMLLKHPDRECNELAVVLLRSVTSLEESSQKFMGRSQEPIDKGSSEKIVMYNIGQLFAQVFNEEQRIISSQGKASSP